MYWRRDRNQFADEIVYSITQTHTQHRVDKPKSQAPHPRKVSMSCWHNHDQVQQWPAELFELVGVEAFLQRQHKQDHSTGQQAKRIEWVILEQHIIKECRQHYARVVEQILGKPRLRNHIELHTEEVVPLDVGGLNLDSLFFILALLHTNHLIERDRHQCVHDQGRIEETHLEHSQREDH